MAQVLELTAAGLYCAAGDFYLDPWEAVPRAIVSHAHGDHARAGSRRYLTAEAGVGLLRRRLGEPDRIQGLPYGERLRVGDATVSLHPAGHVLGSAQIRIEAGGQVWVFSGDYKLAPDPTCEPFTALRCDTFITECTFGLPIYRWPPISEVVADISNWCADAESAGKACLLYAYTLGKAQRLLAELGNVLDAPIYTHGAVETYVREYRRAGVALPPTIYVGDAPADTSWAGKLVLAPPSAHGTPWMRRFGAFTTGFASGWMRIRGTRRRRALDRGFVVSDHVDWPALNEAVVATGCSEVWATHGYVDAAVRWFSSRGLATSAIRTRFEGESGSDESEPGDAVEAAGDPADSSGDAVEAADDAVDSP